MKATIQGIDIEGTPEEVLNIIRRYKEKSNTNDAPKWTPQPSRTTTSSPRRKRHKRTKYKHHEIYLAVSAALARTKKPLTVQRICLKAFKYKNYQLEKQIRHILGTMPGIEVSGKIHKKYRRIMLKNTAIPAVLNEKVAKHAQKA